MLALVRAALISGHGGGRQQQAPQGVLGTAPQHTFGHATIATLLSPPSARPRRLAFSTQPPSTSKYTSYCSGVGISEQGSSRHQSDAQAWIVSGNHERAAWWRAGAVQAEVQQYQRAQRERLDRALLRSGSRTSFVAQ